MITQRDMIIKVCGLREPDNIRAIMGLGVDMMGFIFCKSSKRYVASVPSHTGLLPDYAGRTAAALRKNDTQMPKRVGVFVDEMPQNIITAVYNYHLDYVQLHGSESPVLIENLRRTIEPDIRRGVKFIKVISVGSEDDVKRWREYDGVADMLLFDTKGEAAGGNGCKFKWTVLDAYDGTIPFLLSGGIGLDDAENVLSFSHPAFAGIDLNSRFETAPGLKDVALLKAFISKIRNENE